MNSKTKNKLLILFKTYVPEKEPKEESQMCLIWSTVNPPDILTETEQINDLESAFDIDLSEDEAVQIYNMTISEATIYINKLINKPGENTSQIPQFTHRQGQYLFVHILLHKT